MRGGFGLVLVTAAVALGCEQAPPEYAAPPECRLASAPHVSIGGRDPSAHAFGEVVDATRLDDGRIAVVDRRARSVSLFSDNGTLLGTIGREGEGPGEFLDPIGIDHRGDSLAIWDWRQHRITIVNLSDDQVETIRAEGVTNPTHHLGFDEEGFVLGSRWAERMPPTGLAPFSLRILVLGSGTSAPDTLAQFRYSMMGWVNQALRWAGSPTFGPQGSFTSSPSGVYWTTGDSALIYRVHGNDTTLISWDWPERVVSTEEFEEYRTSRLESLPSQMRERMEKRFEVMPVAEVFPVALDVMPDMDGGVWVEIYPIPSDSLSTWLRVTQEGVVCQLRQPEAFEITEGGADWILAYDEDELGVQTVSLWRLDGVQ